MLPEIRTILYPTDLNPRAPEVFRYAMSLAHRYDAGIVLLHVVEPLTHYAQSLVRMYVPQQGEGLPEDARQRILAGLHQRLRHFCTDEVCVDAGGAERVREIRVLEGQPAEVILGEVERVAPDLVVVGAHGHTAVGEVLIGSVSHKVVQRSPVPVLVVRLPAPR
jgi:nucleotide-binding universal stress UspA family protein